MNYHPKE